MLLFHAHARISYRQLRGQPFGDADCYKSQEASLLVRHGHLPPGFEFEDRVREDGPGIFTVVLLVNIYHSSSSCFGEKTRMRTSNSWLARLHNRNVTVSETRP